jgi:hypothetical protein
MNNLTIQGFSGCVRKQAYFEALDANFPVIQNQDETGRTKITDAGYQWFAELQLFQGKDQQGKSEKTLRAYNYRTGISCFRV